MTGTELAPGQPGASHHRQKYGGGHHAVDHLQDDLEGSDRLVVNNIRPKLVISGDGSRIGGGPDFSVSCREIGDGQPGVLMAHGGAESQLTQN